MKHNSSLPYSLCLRTAKFSARFQPMLQSLPRLSLIGNIVIGGWLAINGHIAPDTFVAFVTYLTSLTALSRPISNMVISIQLTSASIDRTSDVIDVRPDNPEPTDALPPPDGPADINFNHVTHSRGGRMLTDSASFPTASGAALALTGSPGSGKAIVMELLSRHYLPDSGTTTIDAPSHGTSTGTAHILSSDVYDAITVVPDTPYLPAGTLCENAVFANPEAPQGEVIVAATATQVNFVDDLLQGWNTVIGERGYNLSGGQAQRVALARAFLARPRVLVLDNATSAIDAATELEIFNVLTSQLADITVVIVAHRSSTLGQADDITIFEDGAITGIGTRAELIASHSRFIELMDIDRSAYPEIENLVLGPIDSEDPSPEELWLDGSVPTSDNSASDTASRRFGGTTSQISHGVGRTGGGPGSPDGPSDHDGGRGGMEVVLVNAPATPELPECVRNLPPAAEKPHVSAVVLDGSEPSSLCRLLSYVRGLFISVIALFALIAIVDLAFPMLIRHAIGHGTSAHGEAVLWTCAADGLVTVLASWIAIAVNAVITACTDEWLLYTLCVRCYRHLQSFGTNYFETNRSGTIMTRVTTDINTLSSFLQTGLAQGAIIAFTLFGVAALLLTIQVSLIVVALASLPIIVVTTLVLRRIPSRLYKPAHEQLSLTSADLQETIGRLHEIQVYRRVADVESSSAEEFGKYRVICQQA